MTELINIDVGFDVTELVNVINVVTDVIDIIDVAAVQVLFSSTAIELVSQQPSNPGSSPSGAIIVYPGGLLHLVQFSKSLSIQSAQLG